MYIVKSISFPGLGIGEMNLPQSLPFKLFGLEIYWYGVIIAFGFLLAILYGRYRCKDFGCDFDHVIDAILFAVPLAIICARIYYVAFQWAEYKDDPLSAFNIRNGGIAIYGGVIGAVIGLLLFSKVKKQPLLPYLDIAGLGLLIGQLVGRWGNFFNREAYGCATSATYFLRMGLTEYGVTEFVHPTFLYESLWNLLGLILIHFLSKKRKYDGQVFLSYVAWYGLGRVWIEGLRTDSLYIPGTAIRVSQLLAGLSFFAAVGIMLYIHFVKKPDGSKMFVNRKAGSEKAEQERSKAEKASVPSEEKSAPAEEDDASEAKSPDPPEEDGASKPEAPDPAEDEDAPAENKS